MGNLGTCISSIQHCLCFGFDHYHFEKRQRGKNNMLFSSSYCPRRGPQMIKICPCCSESIDRRRRRRRRRRHCAWRKREREKNTEENWFRLWLWYIILLQGSWPPVHELVVYLYLCIWDRYISVWLAGWQEKKQLMMLLWLSSIS